MMNITYFFSGIAMIGALLGGVYFFKFWKKTRDRLFLLFGISFWLLSLERVALLFATDPAREEYSYFYIIRLFAFLIIIVAIVDKNRNSSKSN